MDERARRIGENEALFREVNEKVEELNASFDAVGESFEIVCECGEETCMERITLDHGEYEALRRDPTLFAVKPGHDEPDFESVVARHPNYDVVRKHEGPPRRLAEQTDPRS